MCTIDYIIPVRQEEIFCTVDYANHEKAQWIIFLNGALANHHSVQYLASTLHKNGKNVIRFDFSGQGDSTGNLEKSSLEKRCLEARAVLNFFKLKDKVSIIGTSMGGYIACSLAKIFHFDSIVFFAPAAYTTKAWNVEFGSKFSSIINQKDSYLDSDIIDLLKFHSGNALSFIAENDLIIPMQVNRLYREALSHCKKNIFYTIRDCPHPIHRWVMNYDSIRIRIEKMILDITRI